MCYTSIEQVSGSLPGTGMLRKLRHGPHHGVCGLWGQLRHEKEWQSSAPGAFQCGRSWGERGPPPQEAADGFTQDVTVEPGGQLGRARFRPRC